MSHGFVYLPRSGINLRSSNGMVGIIFDNEIKSTEYPQNVDDGARVLESPRPNRILINVEYVAEADLSEEPEYDGDIVIDDINIAENDNRINGDRIDDI